MDVSFNDLDSKMGISFNDLDSKMDISFHDLDQFSGGKSWPEYERQVEGGEAGDEKEGEEVEPVAARDANIEPDTMVVSLRGGQPTDPQQENILNTEHT